MSTITKLENQPSRRRMPWQRWLTRGLIALVLILVVLVITGASYQAVAARADKRNYPAPGQLVDVGGYQLHIYCQGEGSPTVLLDEASIDTVSDWVWIQPEVARTTRVCAYDRAGVTSAPRPRMPCRTRLRSTLCCKLRASKRLTFWWAIPLAVCMLVPLPMSTLTKWPVWC